MRRRCCYKLTAFVILGFLFILILEVHRNARYFPSESSRIQIQMQFTQGLTAAGGRARIKERAANEDLNTDSVEFSLVTSNHLSITTTTLQPLSVESSDIAAQVTSRVPQSHVVEQPNLPYSHKHICKLPKCMGYFTEEDIVRYKKCPKVQPAGQEYELKGDCEFMRGEGRAPVALASLPGSGNTWIRGLLEKATGICTGSIYCDEELKEGGFNGEGITSGTVLVVKTHHLSFPWSNRTIALSSSKKDPSYGAIVLLLRNPYDAMVAERNRKLAQIAIDNPKSQSHNSNRSAHTLSVGPRGFNGVDGWNGFIHDKMTTLVMMILRIILELPKEFPKLVVHYEDFQKDRVREVSRVLDFLRFPYSPETLSQRLEEDFNSFHRNRHTEFEHYTQYQEKFVDYCLKKILDQLSAKNSGETYGIERYLRQP